MNPYTLLLDLTSGAEGCNARNRQLGCQKVENLDGHGYSVLSQRGPGHCLGHENDIESSSKVCWSAPSTEDLMGAPKGTIPRPGRAYPLKTGAGLYVRDEGWRQDEWVPARQMDEFAAKGPYLFSAGSFFNEEQPKFTFCTRRRLGPLSRLPGDVSLPELSPITFYSKWYCLDQLTKHSCWHL